jgi:glycosyltransferase involved in cell wall biosynthesis
MNPSVSIVIINYNKSDYLRSCLNSVIKHYDELAEVIIVDDQSTDNSVAIIKEYCRRNNKFHLLQNEKNRGPSFSRDRGIRHITSEFFVTLDSDDYLMPNYIKNIKNIFRVHKDAIIVCPFSVVDEFGKIVKTIHVDQFCLVSKKQQLAYLVSRKAGIPGNQIVMSKANYIQMGGLNIQLRLYEDWDFQLRLANNFFAWYAIDAEGFHYRKAGDGLSSLSQVKHLKFKRQVLVENFKKSPYKIVFLSGVINLFWRKGWKYIFNKQDKYGFN